eukprot:TRINITY_DN8283_c0_g1_i14.p1 TRINITY_DN8283_c0_g1~~TRINITY_DN8283_c0_g1_i14.p1  ORF type:complete len:172 (-),score=17.24 TRINITY_DN8283_c0_g1_i14:164-679(-)
MSKPESANFSKYQDFLQSQLKTDLQSLQEYKNECEIKIRDYQEISEWINALDDTKEPKAYVDLGCSFFMKAEILHPDRIYLDVGLGFFAEVTTKEAKPIIDIRLRHLKQKLQTTREKITDVQARIKFFEEALERIMQVGTARQYLLDKTKSMYLQRSRMRPPSFCLSLNMR